MFIQSYTATIILFLKEKVQFKALKMIQENIRGVFQIGYLT